jgi:hypothetical protein
VFVAPHSTICPHPCTFPVFGFLHDPLTSFYHQRHLDLNSKRNALLESWQYIANPEFSSYAHWDPINATSNELRDPDGNPASIVIVGQVVTDKLAVDPLGNFQSQGERQQRYQDSSNYTRDSISCVNSKLVIVLRRPTASLWRADYDTATARLDALQEKVAKPSAPRQHLLDKDQDPPFLRISFPLWDKKVKPYFPPQSKSQFPPRSI